MAVLGISSPSPRDRIEQGVRSLRDSGAEVTVFENVFEQERSYLAGSDLIRLESLNRALNDDRYDGFLFSRGGYGAMRILEGIDYDAIRRNPRPIIGYSDITALHQAVALRAGVATFHGPMLNTDFRDGLTPSINQWFWEMLRGEAPLIRTFAREQVIAGGRAEGALFGGCLSMTSVLSGGPFDFWIDEGIWFWEDVSEPTYRLDRMLTQLKLSGKFRGIRGVLVGKLKDCGGGKVEELDSLLREFFSELGIPVVRDLPFGHHADNLLLPIGRRMQIDTDAGILTFEEPAVQFQKLSRGVNR